LGNIGCRKGMLIASRLHFTPPPIARTCVHGVRQTGEKG